MRELFRFLSGEVPGGALLLTFIALVINLALFHLYRSSKLFSKKIYIRKVIKYNLFLFGIYIILWVFLEPPGLPDRVIVLPFQYEESADYRLSEILERQLQQNINPAYMLHRWEWFYKTANKDSIDMNEYRINLARKIGAAFIITGEIENQNRDLNITLRLIDSRSEKSASLKALSFQEAGAKSLTWIQRNSPIVQQSSLNSYLISDEELYEVVASKIALLQGDYEQVLGHNKSEDSLHLELLTEAYLQKGIAEIEKKTRIPLDGMEMNRDFRHLLNLIIPYSRKGKDTADLNIILARMYMHSENYGMAQVCLDKALTQDKFNPRIYYYMSFLHESRYAERGFNNRAAVLEHAVQLDPGYPLAVNEFAEELYKTGTAAVTDPKTIKSIEVLRNFLVLNPDNELILSSLGRILLQSKYTLEAMNIYTKLISLNPNSADDRYNLGICYFHKQDYKKATEEFQRAIEINDYPDAYLYLGAINKLEGNIDRALYYYRERVKRQQGEDDKYAKEAMMGIRLILNDVAEKENGMTKSGNPQ